MSLLSCKPLKAFIFTSMISLVIGMPTIGYCARMLIENVRIHALAPNMKTLHAGLFVAEGTPDLPKTAISAIGVKDGQVVKVVWDANKGATLSEVLASKPQVFKDNSIETFRDSVGQFSNPAKQNSPE